MHKLYIIQFVSFFAFNVILFLICMFIVEYQYGLIRTRCEILRYDPRMVEEKTRPWRIESTFMPECIVHNYYTNETLNITLPSRMALDLSLGVPLEYRHFHYDLCENFGQNQTCYYYNSETLLLYPKLLGMMQFTIFIPFFMASSVAWFIWMYKTQMNQEIKNKIE